MKSKKVLLTTPDYPPRLGGLSTYTLCVESVLKEAGIEYDLLVWNHPRDLKRSAVDYDIVLNIHYMGGYFGQWDSRKNINFIHGSEILFYSPNPLKRMIKKMMKKNMLNYFHESFQNIFISEFTLEKLSSLGLKTDYGRDIVFHNCIETNEVGFIDKDIQNEIIFSCIVRDVPHKNLDGVVSLLESAAKRTEKKIVLKTNSARVQSEIITIIPLENLSDSDRENVYKVSHFNILLSLDHSHRGFYEGFGLTCLESGKYGVPSIVSNTGGLPENVHHKLNGIVVSDNFLEDLDYALKNYQSMRRWTFDHTHKSHSLNSFGRILNLMGVK